MSTSVSAGRSTETRSRLMHAPGGVVAGGLFGQALATGQPTPRRGTSSATAARLPPRRYPSGDSSDEVGVRRKTTRPPRCPRDIPRALTCNPAGNSGATPGRLLGWKRTKIVGPDGTRLSVIGRHSRHRPTCESPGDLHGTAAMSIQPSRRGKREIGLLIRRLCVRVAHGAPSGVPSSAPFGRRPDPPPAV